MNNQAAQTMPLPEPEVLLHSPTHGHVYGYTTEQMRAYGDAREADALSQPAGVAEGWKLVPVEPTEVMCEAAMSSLGWTRSEAAAKTAPITPASPMMEGSMKVWSAMLAAAPAASGGESHPDALQDGTLSKSTAKRVEALAGASVSERVESGEPANDREALLYLMQQFNSEVWNCERCGHAEETSTMDSADFLRRYLAEHPEQALTQQRGSAEVARLMEVIADAESGMTALFESGDYGMCDDAIEQGFAILEDIRAAVPGIRGYNPSATTPQPSADAVREVPDGMVLVPREPTLEMCNAAWRDLESQGIDPEDVEVAQIFQAMLSAASGEKGVDDTKRLDWIARQGGYEFDFGILNDQPGDGDWFVHGMVGSGQGATFRDAIDAAIKEEAGGQDANTDILDTLAFKTENGDAGRGSVTYIALVASGEADHQQNAAQGGGEK